MTNSLMWEYDPYDDAIVEEHDNDDIYEEDCCCPPPECNLDTRPHELDELPF